MDQEEEYVPRQLRYRAGFEIRPRPVVRNRSIKGAKPLGMALVLSKVNMRSVAPILPLKIQNSNTFNGFFAVVGCFRALL